MSDILEIENIIMQNEKRESLFSKYACKSKDAIRKKAEKSDIRCEFAKDSDRIIHSLAYTRYIDKTQVYTGVKNDNISKRITHVEFVARAAKTIARALNLNEDLCEAISLAHDLGHTPYGHIGEEILNNISKEKLGCFFAHNLNSIRVVDVLEKNGKGLNLTLQVLDGIMCHNGEMVKKKYNPMKKNYDTFLEEYNLCLKDKNAIKSIRPMTMEGCIVRVSDIIGYIGKDIEDALILKRLDIKDIPKEITKNLGTSNKEIMNNIILDIIKNSYGKDYIEMSDKMYEYITKLKEFNYKNIYVKANNKKSVEKYSTIFYKLYYIYINALEKNDIENNIYKLFLNDMSKKYLERTTNAQMVIDYLSGMTDRFIESEYEKYVK